MNKISDVDFDKIFSNSSRYTFIDVRAPIEFIQGHIPQAYNAPILNDFERELIGTTYKKEGSQKAIELGYQLISGETKNKRIQAWIEILKKSTNPILYCFRGGLRSQITQKWLKENQFDVPLIQGGYKKVRQYFLAKNKELVEKNNFILISGPTGSGKSQLIEEISHTDFLNPKSVLHLEKLANHRGSAFGAYAAGSSPQPQQAHFENLISLSLIQASSHNFNQQIYTEDESRLIGQCIIPSHLFEKMRESPVVWIEEELEHRVQRIYQDYILNTAIGFSLTQKNQELEHQAQLIFNYYQKSLQKILRKLGGLRFNEISTDLSLAQQAFMNHRDLSLNTIWIEKLLSYYYDPLYLKSLERRQVKILFRGTYQNCKKLAHNSGYGE